MIPMQQQCNLIKPGHIVNCWDNATDHQTMKYRVCAKTGAWLACEWSLIAEQDALTDKGNGRGIPITHASLAST